MPASLKAFVIAEAVVTDPPIELDNRKPVGGIVFALEPQATFLCAAAVISGLNLPALFFLSGV